ncbi:DUF2798 domain-containing protein [Pontibacter actiniarum]|uniref:DUF2798 domain-containing protein n=1 Tax=Pontibacter actiniarum TaxID=323450 RepID=A0A1X9YX07_9BACT|nr:DUF2798 domain-containing protein [Pontibacter actiniarum]ARS37362.1 DUF2798 domain-containing protein [Pontibacter actiniarum]
MKRVAIKPQLRRRLLLIAITSLLLASALELYTFGLHADFPGRWLRSFFVFFVMISVTVLAIVPGVNYGVAKVWRK